MVFMTVGHYNINKMTFNDGLLATDEWLGKNQGFIFHLIWSTYRINIYTEYKK
jgi:hypothetical protein